jgi:hypothetical protein
MEQTEKMKPTYETINMVALKRLPVLKLAPTYYLQKDPGNGCAGDPPGYPTYFTRSVYTQYGNSPGRGPQLVLLGHVVTHSNDWRKSDNWETYQARKDTLMRKLWKPLPIDHPRTRAWILDTYRNHHNCYKGPEEKGPSGRDDRTVIWPCPYYVLDSFHDDERFSDKWREEEKARIEAKNKEVIAYYQKFVSPENHQAVIIIKRYFPDYKPELDLIENPPQGIALWWERFERRPSPQECPGDGGIGKHPTGSTWCQLCGWSSEEVAKVKAE